MRVYFNASDAHPDLFSAVRRRYIFIVDRFEFLQDQFPDLYLNIIFQDIRVSDGIAINLLDEFIGLGQ